MSLDPRLLDILVCPLTRTRLRHEVASNLLVSEAAGLAFPVRDGIPILLLEEAKPWPQRPGEAVSPVHP